MNPVEYLIFRAATQGDSPALLLRDQAISFNGLLRAVRLRAQQLKPFITSQQAIVGIRLAHPIEEWVTILACFYLGVCSTSNPPKGTLPPQYEPTVWVLDEEPNDVATPYLNIAEDVVVKQEPIEPATINPKQIARIFYTSGTTGRSKPVAVTYETQQFRSLMRSVNGVLTASAILMMPVESAAGLLQALHFISVGAPVALTPSAQDVPDMVKTWGIQAVYASPNQFGHVLQELKRAHKQIDLPHLYLTGSSITTAMLSTIQTLMPSTSVYSVCGATEVGFLALKPIDSDKDLGRWGIPGPGVTIQVVDRQGQQMVRGQMGSIRVQTPYMSSVYLDTGAEIDGHWFYTGDLGLIDEDGEVVFEGRSDDVMNLDGVKVNVSTLEQFLQAQVEVVDAAAFVVNSPEGLRELWAAVHLAEGADLSLLVTKASTRLDRLQCPKRILPVAFIPRTYTGKPQRQLMADKVIEMLKMKHSSREKHQM